MHASGDFCCLMIIFASSLDPDQDQQDTDIVAERIFCKVNIKKSQQLDYNKSMIISQHAKG